MLSGARFSSSLPQTLLRLGPRRGRRTDGERLADPRCSLLPLRGSEASGPASSQPDIFRSVRFYGTPRRLQVRERTDKWRVRPPSSECSQPGSPAATICPVSFLAPIKQTQHCVNTHAHARVQTHTHTAPEGRHKSYLFPSYYEKPHLGSVSFALPHPGSCSVCRSACKMLPDDTANANKLQASRLTSILKKYVCLVVFYDTVKCNKRSVVLGG